MKDIKLDKFHKAKITLTLWYTLILAVIVALFSISEYIIQVKDYTRIILTRESSVLVPRQLIPD